MQFIKRGAGALWLQEVEFQGAAEIVVVCPEVVEGLPLLILPVL